MITELQLRIADENIHAGQIHSLNIGLLFSEMEQWYKDKCNWEHRGQLAIRSDYVPPCFLQFIKDYEHFYHTSTKKPTRGSDGKEKV